MKATPEQIEKARRMYETDDIQIDDNAKVSEDEASAYPDAGVWVQAWVWIPPKEKPTYTGLDPVPESAEECEFGDEEYQWRLRQAGL